MARWRGFSDSAKQGLNCQPGVECIRNIKEENIERGK